MKIYNFKRDLKFGNIYEKKAFEKLKNYNNDINLTCIYNNDYKYDFKTNNNDTYEVKADKRSQETGNIFIEYLCKGRDSGINKTEATYYIITDTENYYKIKTDDLKEYIKNNINDIKKIVFKSDVGLVHGLLIKINDFKNINNIIIL